MTAGSWSAPVIGAPDRYVVWLRRLAVHNGATTAPFVATLYTTRTQLILPPGLLQAGATYFATIKAVVEAAGPVDVAPYRASYDNGYAYTLTATFAP
jgi:hypothetical protein